MGRDDAKQPFTDLPTPREIAAFNPKKGRSCTADRFRVDLTGTPRSQWNFSAAEVFASDFCAAHPNIRYSRQDVLDAWITHFDSLRDNYRMQEAAKKDSQILENVRTEKRRTERRSTLYRRRYDTAKLLSKRLQSSMPVELVTSLGVDGMSSDESGHEGRQGEPTFFITGKPWRARSVTTWVRTLDSLHIHARYRGEWKATAGAWPRIRVTSTVESQRAAVPGLPRNFYSGTWFKTLSEYEAADLQPETPMQAMHISEEITKYVRSNEVYPF
ncbi:hypothetical protein BJ138DRAFT_1020240 [Hygrophoropsis aurantiaca]|uniref:Uncharacterized protein n=1 Tax=Hygrophoropsis aurantiaca TaxID=72124 RepID=A0ACB7ZRI0_9AGAM|nr:hypothetical protein BJ138DRAFT_1020240 [Hygrophoropsis aurantiaca]